MMLAHYSFSEPFEWNGRNVCTLIVEDPKLLRAYAGELLEQCEGGEGRFVLSQELVPLEFHRTVELITDVFRTDPSANKRITSGMIKELATVATHDLPEECSRMFRTIHETLSAVIFAADAEAVYDECFDLSAVMKLCDLRPDTSGCSLPERLLLYMELCRKYVRKQVFILFHLHDYLTTEEMHCFIQDLIHRELNVLFVETQEPAKDPAEQRKLIDKDMCEI